MVSTGLGSTAWLKSVVTGGIALARAVHGLPVQQIYLSDHRVGGKAIDIREPFPVRTPQATLVYAEPLTLRSRVPDAASFSPTEWKPTSCVFMRAWRPSLASPKSQADSWCEAPFCLY